MTLPELDALEAFAMRIEGEGVIEAEKEFRRALVSYWRAEGRALCEDGMKCRPLLPCLEGIASALREYAGSRQKASGKWDGRSNRLVDWAILIDAARREGEGHE